jgi:hypothetical protein
MLLSEQVLAGSQFSVHPHPPASERLGNVVLATPYDADRCLLPLRFVDLGLNSRVSLRARGGECSPVRGGHGFSYDKRLSASLFHRMCRVQIPWSFVPGAEPLQAALPERKSSPNILFGGNAVCGVELGIGFK